ncbi:MAG: T9SS type B sorting domain-containing protein [Bacteroidota bacterium]
MGICFREVHIEIISLFLILGHIGKSFAQLNATTIGSASSQPDNCYIITPDQLNQSGAVWFDNAIDLSNDFSINYQVFYGTKDVDGADGTAFVFKRTATPLIGGNGGGIGYAGISNSLIVEFDTFQNIGLFSNNDPVADHIAILRDGNPDHGQGTNLAGPVQASATSANIEDGQDHEVKIAWDATGQTLSVYFDCILRLTFVEDIKNTIFSGDDSIFFGVVGSTGGLSNLNRVCFNSITFVDNLTLADQSICIGDTLDTVDATVPSGVTYQWSSSTLEMSISDPNNPSPSFSPTVTTTYTVTITDICGESITESFTVDVLPIETPAFNPIEPICENESLSALPTTSLNGITGSWSPALDNTATTTYTFTPDPNECATPTTLQIVVIPLTIPTFNAISPICPGDIIPPLPTISNNSIVGSWSPALNNMETTTYSFTPASGQGCVAETTLTIAVQGQVPEFDPIAALCAGENITALPTTSNNGIVGSWNPSLNNSVTTVYTFTPYPGQCSFSTTIEIVIIPIRTLQIRASTTTENFDDNQTIEVTVTGGIAPYEYRLDDGPWQENNVFKRVEGCLHTITVRQVDLCSNSPETSITVLTYPKFFTPNGDQYNNNWNIFCLSENPTARVSIFDRYGKLITQLSTSSIGWNGRFNNRDMPAADYWFLLEYEEDDGSKTFSSHFTLKR